MQGRSGTSDQCEGRGNGIRDGYREETETSRPGLLKTLTGAGLQANPRGVWTRFCDSGNTLCGTNDNEPSEKVQDDGPNGRLAKWADICSEGGEDETRGRV